MQNLLTETDAAARLGVRPATLRRWRWAGRGPIHVKLPGSAAVRYAPADLDDYAAAGRRTSTTDAAPAA